MSNDSDYDLKLLAGLPIEICGIKIYPVKLIEIAEIGEKNFYNMLWALCFDIEDIENYEEIKDQLSDLKSFDIVFNFCIYDNVYLERVLRAFKLFLKQEVYIDRRKGVFYTDDLKVIDREIFDDIRKILKLQNHIEKPETEKYNPANSEARELLEKIKSIRKNAPIKKQDIDLHSIIRGIYWKSGKSKEEIWNLSLSELFEGYDVLGIIENYQNIMYGIYSGSVDSSKINKKDIIHWSTKIKK